MTELPPASVPLTLRELHREPAMLPGGPLFDDVVRAYLPLVHGVALLLIPEKADVAREISVAVWRTFQIRARKISKRTALATWFLRTTCFAAFRERRHLKLPSSIEARRIQRVVKKLSRFKPKYLDPLLLRSVLKQNLEATAKTLGSKPGKLEKLESAGRKKLSRLVRKYKTAPDEEAFLGKLTSPVSVEFEAAVRDSVTVQQPKDRIVTGVLRAWRWVALRQLVARVAASAGLVVMGLMVVGGAFIYLATHGYLTDWFIQQEANKVRKEFPELAKPAGGWPTKPEDEVHVAKVLPADAAGLYVTSNIWLAKLDFTAEEWEKITPTRIEPVRNFMRNGRIILRNPNAKRSGLSGVLGYDFNWAKGQLEFCGQKFKDVAVRIRGNGTYLQSRYGPKQSLKVDLNKFVKKQDIVGLNELNFLNCIADNSYMFDALAQRLFRDLGVPGPRTSYAYLTVNAPGKFDNQALGLYAMVENIDGDFAKDRFGTKETPIFKPVTYELFTDWGDDWTHYAAIYDLKTKATPEQLSRVVEFAKFVTHASDEEFARRLAEYLDLENFAGFVGGHVLLSSYDGFFANGQNFYLFLHPRSNKFGFIPWDQDHGWGEFRYMGSVESREQASIWKPAVYDFQFLNRVMKVEAFRKIYRQKLEHALEKLFLVDRLYAQVDQLGASIRPAIAAESAFRLKRFDQAISSEPNPNRNGGPPEGPGSAVHQIKQFIPNRINSIREQLDDPSKGARIGKNY